MRKATHFFFGADMWKTRLGVMTAMSFMSLLWFVIDWCSFTTFRSMSDPLLWVNNILGAFILTLPYLLTRRVWVQVLWIAAVDLLLLADIMYCRTYFTSIPLDSFALVGNLSDFTASIYTSLRPLDIGFLVILVGGVAWSRKASVTIGGGKQLRFICCIAVLSLISFVGVKSRGGFHKEYDRLVQSCYYSTCGTPTYTFAGHILYSLADRNRADEKDMEAVIDQWLTQHQEMMPSPALPDSIARRKNLVVILLESFESWLIESEVNGKVITPYLNSLVNDSTSFYAPLMLTQVGSGRSIDCQLLLHAGLTPMVSSVYSMKYPNSTYLTLNKALKEKYGTRSTILTCDKPITWNQEVISRSFGYDTLIDRRDWVIDELVGNPGKLSDGSFLRQSVDKLRNENLWPVDSAAMLTFVTYSGHSPFRLPDTMKDPDFDLSDSKLPAKLIDYITMAHYTDSQLHTLVDYLQSRPDSDSTLILITGDHEGLASWRKEIRNSSPQAAELVAEGQFTPLILLNSPVTGRRNDIMGQIDMYPTLLNLLGLDEYKWKGLGQSIFAPGYPGVAISTMTKEISGDTTSIDARLLDHITHAQTTSDGIILSNYLKSR